MTEIIIIAAASEAALNWWKEDLLRYSKYGKPQAERKRLEIITPTCRIRYRSGRQRNEGLRADLVYGAGEDERKTFMCKSEYKKEDCTMESIRKIIIDGFKKEEEKEIQFVDRYNRPINKADPPSIVYVKAGIEICIHHYAGCGREWFLNIREIGIDNQDLNTEDFETAVKTAQEAAKKKLSKIQKCIERFTS